MVQLITRQTDRDPYLLMQQRDALRTSTGQSLRQNIDADWTGTLTRTQFRLADAQRRSYEQGGLADVEQEISGGRSYGRAAPALRERAQRIVAERNPDIFLSPEQATEENKDLGLTFDRYVSRAEIEIYRERKTKEQIELGIMGLGPQVSWGNAAWLVPAQIGSAMIGMAHDPMELAGMFVPFVGPVSRAALAARFGLMRGRMAESAIEATLGTAMMEVPYYALSQAQQRDWTMSQSLLNVGAGALFGGAIIGPIRGAWANRSERRRARADQRVRALSNISRRIERGEEVDITAFLAREHLSDGERRDLAFRVAISQAVNGEEVNVKALADIDDFEIREIEREAVALREQLDAAGLDADYARRANEIMRSTHFSILQRHGITRGQAREVFGDMIVEYVRDREFIDRAVGQGADAQVSGQSLRSAYERGGREEVARILRSAGDDDVARALSDILAKAETSGLSAERLRYLEQRQRLALGSAEASRVAGDLLASAGKERDVAIGGANYRIRRDSTGKRPKWVVTRDGVEISRPQASRQKAVDAAMADAGETIGRYRSTTIPSVEDMARAIEALPSESLEARQAAFDDLLWIDALTLDAVPGAARIAKQLATALTGKKSWRSKADALHAIARMVFDETRFSAPEGYRGPDADLIVSQRVERANADLGRKDVASREVKAAVIDALKRPHLLDEEARDIVLTILRKMRADDVKTTVSRALNVKKPKTIKDALEVAKGALEEGVARDGKGRILRQSERSGVVDSEGRELTREQAEFLAETKVVDAEGRPLRVYHGTRAEFDAFDPSRAPDGQNAVFFSDSKSIAYNYGATFSPQFYRERGEAVPEPIAAYLKMERPLVVDVEDLPRVREWRESEVSGDLSRFGEQDLLEVYLDDLTNLVKTVDRSQYDGIIARNMFDRGPAARETQYIVFEPNQIKDITNLAPTSDPRLMFQGDPRSALMEIVTGEASLPGFVSAPLRAVETAPMKERTVQQWRGWLKKQQGVTDEEWKWLGLDQHFAELGDGAKLSREDLAAFIRSNQVELEERVLGGDGGATRLVEDVDTGLGDGSRELVFENGQGQKARYAVDVVEDGRYIVKWRSEVLGDGVSLDEARHLAQGHSANVLSDVSGRNRPIFGQHVIPGGEPGTYREVLVRWPELEGVKGSEGRYEARIDELLDRQDAAEARGDTAEVARLEAEMDRLHADKNVPNRWASPHFNDQEIVHIRMDDRTGPNGERILFVQEIQSDLHQRGRREGYQAADAQKKNAELRQRLSDVANRTSEAAGAVQRLEREATEYFKAKLPKNDVRSESVEIISDFQRTWNSAFGDDYQRQRIVNFRREGEEAIAELRSEGKIADAAEQERIRLENRREMDRLNAEISALERLLPDAPFKDDRYLHLALKTALRRAVDEGYDAIAFARSDQIAEAVGESAGGLRTQYDEKMPKWLSKYVRQWGARVERAEFVSNRSDDGLSFEDAVARMDNDIRERLHSDGIDTQSEFLRRYRESHAERFDGEEFAPGLSVGSNPLIRITPEMREGVKKGQALFQFGGASARTADRHALSAAQRRISAGENAETVRKETGWHQGVDGKWRFEIDDSAARWVGPKTGPEAPYWRDTLGNVIDHDRLFTAYPELRNLEVHSVNEMAEKAMIDGDRILFRSDLSPEERLSSVMHEVQHWIQVKEGFARGSSPEEVVASGRAALGDDAAALAEYRRTAGEIEARNTQARLDMSAEERRAVSPEATQDVESARAVVIWDDGSTSPAPRALTDALPQGAPETAAPRGMFDRDTGAISLFERADESTLMHEAAHYYLELMGRLSVREGAPDSLRGEMREIMDWLGVDRWENVRRQHHERWAEAFERYLERGEPPAEHLRGAFDAFRQWLRKLWDQFVSRKPKRDIDPQIKAIMDRLVAPDEYVDIRKALKKQTPEQRAHDDVMRMLEEADRFEAAGGRAPRGDVGRQGRAIIGEQRADVDIANAKSEELYRQIEAKRAAGELSRGEEEFALEAEAVRLDADASTAAIDRAVGLVKGASDDDVRALAEQLASIRTQLARGEIGGRAELEAIAADLESRLGEVEAKAEGETPRTLMQSGASDSVLFQLDSAAAALREDIQTAAAVRRRNMLINANKRGSLLAVMVEATEKHNDAHLGLLRALDDVNADLETMGAGAGPRGNMAAQQLHGGFANELISKDLLQPLRDGRYTAEIAEELVALQSGGTPGVSGVKVAQDIAETIHRWQETARKRMNSKGAWIRENETYVTATRHSSRKIKDAGFMAWAAEIAPRLDWDRMDAWDPDEGQMPFLRSVYGSITSGYKLLRNRKPGATAEDDIAAAFKGPANLARGVSEHRLLQWKSGRDWVEYNQRYGDTDLFSSITSSLDNAGRVIGLMDVFGTNPESMMRLVVDDFMRHIEAKTGERAHPSIDRLIDDSGQIRAQISFIMDELLGRTMIARNKSAARTMSSLRAIQAMAKLSLATVSAMADTVMTGQKFVQIGRDPIIAATAGWQAAFEGLATSRGWGNAEKRQMLDLVGVGLHGTLGEMVSRVEIAEDHSRGMQRALNTFFRWIGMTGWTDAIKRGSASMFMRELAMKAGRGFADLERGYNGDLFTKYLRNSGIDEGSWLEMSQLALRDVDGATYMDPARIYDAAKTAFSNAERERLIKLGDTLNTMIVEFTEGASPTPGVRDRALLHQGTQRGTWSGEMIRSMGQFKAFPFTAQRRVLGPIMNKGGGLNLRNAYHVATFVAQLGIMGAAVIWAKDALKFRSFRDWSDEESPLPGGAKWDFVSAAFLQSGGMGIYGDFLLGRTNRFGNTPLETAAGPLIGAGADLLALAQRGLHGAAAGDLEPGVGGDAIRFAQSNAPFVNMFPVKNALDYLVVFHLQELANPGYLRRMEKRMKRNTGSEFMIPPSSVVARGGGFR